MENKNMDKLAKYGNAKWGIKFGTSTVRKVWF